MTIPSSPLVSEKSLALVSSAVLFALLDALAAKGILERGEIQDVLKSAQNCVGVRQGSFCSAEAIHLMTSLCQHFDKVPEERQSHCSP